MSIPVYCINLDRSADRWKRMSDAAARFDIDLRRIAAVDGAAIDPRQRIAGEVRFTRQNGRPMLPGEYGCYRSHLLALETVATGDAEAAVIIEDDVELNDQLPARAAAIHAALPGAGVVKLLNHRARGFIRKATAAPGGVDIGRCLHGPQGSAACYLVTRSGARRLLGAIDVMTMPFDIALERGWQTGVPTYTVRRNLIELGPMKVQTEIASVADYAAVKRRGFAKLPAHLFRLADYASRIAYALHG